ncbi:hypothetical protein COO60DRAFT_1463541 [Scenedesmus sp. NREL 46B-D3]|nr:hypothetical protein COO60DRAFT_1463541 [Scenedesmus sp. NREL 46B-D3]
MFDWSVDALAAHATNTSAGGDLSAASATVAGAVASSDQEQLCSLRWAAFCSDSEHEVLPVTDGYRITLTYSLRAVGLDSTNDASSPRWGCSSDSPAAAGPDAAAQAQEEVPVSAAAADAAEPKIRRRSKQKKAATAADISWLTPADVASSLELTQTVQALLANKEWYPEGKHPL